MEHTTDTPVAEANRLYWETDIPVAEIAEQLDISRRALYGAVQPREVGEPCYHCGAQLLWENRSARSSNTAYCPECNTDEDAAEEPPRLGDDTPAAELFAGAPHGVPLDPERIRIGAGLLAGAATGAILTLLLVPRR